MDMVKPALAFLASGVVTAWQAATDGSVEFLRWVVPVLLVAIAWLVRNGYKDIATRLGRMEDDIHDLKDWQGHSQRRIERNEQNIAKLEGA